MKHMRHWLMMVTLLCGLAANAHNFEVDGIYYNITSSSNLTVEVTYRGYYYDSYSNEYSGAVTIPSTVTYNSTTYSVTSIGGYAFYICSSLTSITIPEGVTSIGDYAFYGCRSLTSITIPEGVTSIGGSAFSNCSSLTAITIPESVTSIGVEAFAGCSSLTAIVVAGGNAKYDSRNGCNAIIETSSNTLIVGCSSTVIPEGVTIIGDHAFDGCSSLTSITIPESVKSIGVEAFSDCTSLTAVHIKDIVSWCNINFSCLQIFYLSNPLYYAKNLYLNGELVTELTIPNTVTAIKPGAFYGFDGFTSITIPEGVTSIGGGAFALCSNLTSITIPESVKSIGWYAFHHCRSLTSITIPEGVTSIKTCTFYGCSSLTSITIPEGVTSIGETAFYNCSSLTSITIPESVTSIGEDAFAGCTGELIINCNTYESLNKSKFTKVTIGEGVTSIASAAFYNCSSLTSITIPESVTSIGGSAFSYCENLKEVYCSTLEPIQYKSFFYGSPIEAIYVPAYSLDLYMEADGWKNYNIEPIFVEDKLVVNLPKVASDVSYSDMYIELVGTNGDLINKYLIGERQSYTFYNLDRNQVYSIYLKNRAGVIFGSIPNIHLGNVEHEVTFNSLLKPQDVIMKVLTPDGTDVTKSAIATWYDADGNYLCKDAVLSGQVENTEVKYSVKLSKELAMQYKQPEQATYMVKPSGNEIKEILEPFASVEVTGMVRDSVTGTPISDAMVTFSQKLNGEYAHITRAETDSKGAFKATLYDVPAEVTVAAADYISYTMSLDTLTEPTALGEILMKPISGVVVSVGFTYRTSVPDGDTPEILGWYTDYANVKYGILNKTTGLPISNFSVQYPQLVLLDGVSAGDELLLTVVSRTGSFEPTQTAVVVDSTLQCDATFDIVELGGIEASYTTTTNSAVVGILYNEIGEMVQKRSYTSGSLTIDNLRDGSYTLVTMGSSDYFNAIYNLAQLSAVGLVEGADYVKHAVKVESGVVSVVEMESVPAFDESKLYYTGGDTRFTVNKTSATAGNYLTLTGKIDFKEEYASKVSNVSMVIDLPESAVFVDNSVMIGAAVAAYTLEGNRLTISLPGNYTERVRFCIIPTESGSYAPTAFAQFTVDGKEVLQPIGSAHYTIKDLSIEVLSISAKTTIPVSGVAIGNSTIQIYDNDVLIGETTSLANGVWSATCELHEPYNLSKHRIHAKVITSMGLELTSEVKECMYDMNAVQVSKVTMINVAHPAGSLKPCEYVTVFDFLHPAKSIPAYWYWPNYPEFTFLIEFTDNDTTKVSNVVLWVETSNGNQVPLNAAYDENKGLWVASGNFGSWTDYDLPANVSLDFDCRTEMVIDVSESVEITKDVISLTDDFAKGCQVISDYLNNNKLDYDKLYSITDSLGIPIRISMENSDAILPVDFDSWSLEEQEEYVENELEVYMAKNDQLISSLAYLDSAFTYQKEISVEFDGVYFTVKSCDGVNLADLIDNGFTENITTNGTKVYSKITESTVICVDLANDLYMESNIIKEVAMFAQSSSSDNQSALQKYSDCMEAIKRIMDVINLKWTELQTLAQFPVEKLDEAILEIETRLVNVTNWKNNSKISVSKKMKWAIEEDRLIHALAGAKLARKICGPLIKRLLKAVPYAGYVATLNDCYHDSNQILSLYNSIPEPCPDDSEKASSCKNWCYSLWGSVAALATVDVIGSFSSDAAIVGGVIGSFATAGTSLGATAAGAVAKAVIAIGGVVADSSIDWSMGELGSEISSLRCNKDCGEPGMPPCPNDPDSNNPDDPKKPTPPNPTNNGGEHKSNNPNVGNVQDPSGYVYEGVSSNRLEGVMASCYYKETVEDIYGDQHENVVLWDAEQYAQENPLFTDANGMYRWDVPKGLWQVKFEKEGYETTYSDWLPVPPPQLEVNIPMVQNKQPEVADVHAYKDGVEIEFDKYMQPATLNTDNIFVIQNGEKVAGKVTLLNEEVAYEGQSETYASKVRFVFDQAITAKEITLTVVNSVKSYAGLQMQDTYIQTLAIEQEVESIVADSLVSMYYGGEQTLTVKVIPAAAAAGKTLVVTSSSPTILGVDTDSIVLDDSGEAVLTVSGELPGMGAISYSLVGYDYRASTLVEVVYDNTKMTANPTASIASGTTVAKGTEVTLSCSTEGAAIYYTLDGSCPCDDTAILYDGTPIVINENSELRIMAMAEGMYESDVVVYNYYVEGVSVEDVVLPLGIEPTIVTDGFRVQGIETEYTVSVYGVGGELVLQRERVKNNAFINIAHVPEGMYIVVVSKDDDTYKQRILKVE